MTTTIFRFLVLANVLLLSSCTAFWQMGAPAGSRDGVSSSLVDYLYPKGEVPPEQSAQIPRLNLPLRAGIAFVPGTAGPRLGISEATKTQLLDEVRRAFRDRDYIEHIEVIPETYLRSSKGFEGLQQVARLYGVDVMALVSYDQVSISDDTRASLLYWTIVGAYLIKGTENEVQTFVDTAVFDVATRKLLFRAPGTDKREARSTAIESSEQLREQGVSSFAAAMQQMTANLAGELDLFEQRLDTEPQLAQVEWSPARGGGGGGLGPGSLASLLLVRWLAARRRQR